MRIQPATARSIDDLMALRIEAEQWLAAAGIDQWRDPATRGPALEKWMADIAADRTWIVVEDQAVLATVTLAPADQDFWTPEDDLASAVYVAKLITARKADGLNLGGRLLDWAGSQARQKAKPWVRLDCWRANTRLQQFYLEQGFAHVRTEAPAHRLSGWLGQRSAALVRYPNSPLTSTDAPKVAS